MSKLKKLIAGLFALIVIISLASCGGSGVQVEMDATCTSTSIKINLTFGNFSALENGATAYVKRNDSTSSSAYKNLEFTNKDYSKSSCEYTGLTEDTEYSFSVYISYNDNDEKIAEAKYKTKSISSEDVIEISNKDDLLNIDTDATKLNYKLTDNIDLDGSEILMFDSSSNKYEGTFDGNGFTINNFKLKSASASGLFGYTNGATFKNLTISNVSFTTTSTKSKSDMGVLVGNAEDTKFENITISNIIYGKRAAENQFSGTTSAELRIGGLVGNAVNSTFDKISITNASILMTKARKYVSIGLLAGEISGNKVEVAVKDSSVSGEIYVNCEYSSSTGYTRVGGFIGTLSTTGVVQDSSSEVEIAYTRRNGSGYVNHDLFIGGFLGKDGNAQINVKNCLSVADIICYAGQKSDLHNSSEELTEEQKKTDVSTNLLATNAYIGGFAGSLSNIVSSVSNCVYAPRVEGIKVYAQALKEVTKDDVTTNEKYVDLGLFYGACSNVSKISNCGYAKENLLVFGDLTDTYTNKVTELNLKQSLLDVLNAVYEKKNTVDATTVKA